MEAAGGQGLIPRVGMTGDNSKRTFLGQGSYGSLELIMYMYKININMIINGRVQDSELL